MILGGTGARLEDLVGAYAALNRDGIAGRVRYRPDAPRVDRRLLSPGAAWIVREILEAHPRPGSVADTFDPAFAHARGLEDRHELRLSRCVGAGQHAALHRRRVGGASRWHAAARASTAR